ncbi:DUF1330 domain-containing protein [Bradyrhizobium sp.]|uniref:DUF1330 domain-containing protein n=1 Tax=Bradyrhizobium sp. TaxID=376 RepID=UPI0039193D5A
MVAQLKIIDRAAYDRYLAGFFDVFRNYNVRLPAADEAPISVEGRWDGDKIVLISFPDEYDFRAWAESAADQELAPDRKAGAEAIVLLVRGFGERPDRTATLIRRRS